MQAILPGGFPFSELICPSFSRDNGRMASKIYSWINNTHYDMEQDLAFHVDLRFCGLKKSYCNQNHDGFNNINIL